MPTVATYRFTELAAHAQTHALRDAERALPPLRVDAEGWTSAFTAALADACGAPAAAAADWEVVVWDPHRCRHWSITAVLRPDLTPALPWTPQLRSVQLNGPRTIHIHHHHAVGGQTLAAMTTAVRTALHTARQSAHRLLSMRQALEWIAACRPRFTADGHLAAPPA